MQKKRILSQKTIAILCVIVMMLANSLPILSNISFAESQEEFVKVNGYFSTAEIEKESNIDCDVQEENLMLNLEIKAIGKGYLKNGKFKFGENLNFEIKEENEVPIKDGEIQVPYIKKDESESWSIPIIFSSKEIYDKDYFSKTNKVTFTGVFVDNDGKEHTIEQVIDLKLNWKQESKTKIETDLIKNLNYEKDGIKGKILQFALRVSKCEKENIIPVKNTNIQIQIPEIPGMEYSDTTVECEKLSFTQGRSDYEILSEDVSYTISEGYINILANNGANESIMNSSDEDTYIITLFYEGEEEEPTTVVGKINGLIKNYSDNEENIEIEAIYDLSSPVGGVVSYVRENKANKISKGYLLADSQQEKYEITYIKKDCLYISRSELISSVEIVDKDEFFIDESGKTYSTEVDENKMSLYSKTEFSKENLVNILGTDGKIEILSLNDEVLSTITMDMDADENGNFIVEYNNPVSKIKIRTSSPVNDGMITIISQKVMKKLDYSKDIVKQFVSLQNQSQGYTIYNEGIVDDLGVAQSSIEFSPTVTEATIEVGQKELSTIVNNENVNIQIKLNNNEETSDLYENPIFEVRLPQAIQGVSIKNIDMFYANGELEIEKVESLKDGDNNVIRISLFGTQTSYDLNKETNGTIISIDTDLVVNEFIGNVSEMIELYYINQSATTYTNSLPWNMVLEENGQINGYAASEISYKGPEELIMGQATETKEEEANEAEENTNNRVSTVKQGADSELLEENVEAKLATMFISMINNTQKRYTNFVILGRIPFAGNKNIQTGEDLGTTVDTILHSEITTEYADLEYKVYYSENGEATEDLENPDNGWNENYFKMGEIKSYLIVFNSEYVFEPGDSIEFMYDYVIPADLQPGDAFYGIYNTYYNEVDNESFSEIAPDKIGYETEKIANLEASMYLNGELKENSDSRLEFNILNTSEADAKNIRIVMPKDEMIYVKDVYGENISLNQEDENVIFEIPLITKNSEFDFTVEIGAFRKPEGKDRLSFKAEITGENIETKEIETEEYEILENRFEVNSYFYDEKIKVGQENSASYSVYNIDDKDYENVVITKKFDNAFSIISAEVIENENATIEIDQAKNEIRCRVKEFKQDDIIIISYKFEIKNPGNNQCVNKAKIENNCNLGNGEEFNTVDIVEYKIPIVSIEKLNLTETGYSKTGSEIEYKYKITNNSIEDAVGMSLDVNLSGDAIIDSINIYNDNFESGEMVRGEDSKLFVNVMKNDYKYLTIRVIVNDDAKEFIQNEIHLSLKNIFDKKITEYTIIENQENDDDKKLSGIAYVDSNVNQQFDDNEPTLGGIVVNLYNSLNNECVGSTVTDMGGRYLFDIAQNNQYYVKFNYDETKYSISKDSNELSQNKANVLNINNNYVTDNISVSDTSIANVNLPLTNENKFDMSINSTVEKMTVQNSAENTEFIAENKKLAKVDINPDLVSDSRVLIEYKIEVKNQGTLEGNVNKIVDYIDDDIVFDSTLNPDWYLGGDGNLYTTALKDTTLKPGESKELRLVLIRKMTDENTGLVHNCVEIAEAVNSKGIADVDSTANNRLDEDDLSYADSIIGISTGLSIGVLPIVLVGIVVLILIGFVVWKIIDERRYV